MSWAIGKKKFDFVGKRGLERPDLVSEGRKQLVGLLTKDPKIKLEEGAQITVAETPSIGTPAEGHVTSSYYSPALDRSIALAVVKNGRNRKGDTVYVPMKDKTIACEIVDPIFYDPEGSRMNG